MTGHQIAFVLLGLFASGAALAHKLAPALLEISAEQPGHYQVLWRVGTQTPPLTLHWPSNCSTGEPSLSRQGTALDQRYSLHCQPSLAGQTLHIEGLEAARTAVLLRLNLTQTTAQQLMTAAQPRYRFAAQRAQASVIVQYLILGVEHILIGLDHLLLVLGLFLITRGWTALAANVTAFTLGHSVTLAVVSLDILRVPAAWVELSIALTILALALSLTRGRHISSARRQWPVFSLFGLIHGMGFAGVLGDIGLPKQDLLSALLAFNIGIELGQVAFLALLAAFFATTLRIHKRLNRGAQTLSIYAMGSLACFWCIERSLTLLN